MVVDGIEYIAIVISEKSGTTIKMKPSLIKRSDSDSWDTLAYVTELQTEIITPLAQLQNNLLAIGLFQPREDETKESKVHILDCSSIHFRLVNTLDIKAGRISSLCGITGSSGEQLIACVTAFDGLKKPVVVYSVDNNQEVWRFTGENTLITDIKECLDEIRFPMNPSPNHAHHSVEKEGEIFQFGIQRSGISLPLPVPASSVLRQRSPHLHPWKAHSHSIMSTMLAVRFIASDVCAVDDHSMFVADTENREVLQIDSEGAVVNKVLTKEDLGNFAVDYIQCIFPSKYLVTICSPRPIKELGDRVIIIWRLSTK